MLNSFALYYPNIAVPDNSWLRTSLLLWEKIGAIVPKAAQPTSNHISWRLCNEGLMRFIDPVDHLREINESKFLSGFKRLMRQADIVDYLQAPTHRQTIMHVSSIGDPCDTGQVHSSKLSERILRYLVERHGAERQGDWVDCGKAGNVYVSYLASHMKDLWGASPLTNLPDFDELMDAVERSRTQNPAHGAMASVVSDIETRIPVLPPDYPVEGIIDIRRKHARPYERFRRSFSKLRSGLNRAEDEESAAEAAEQFKWDLDDSFDELAHQAHKAKWDMMHASIRTVLSVSGVAAALLLAGDLTKTVGQGAAGVILAYKFGEEMRKMRLEREKAIRSNEFSYLFLIGQELGD
jgi:hypothetical protein